MRDARHHLHRPEEQDDAAPPTATELQALQDEVFRQLLALPASIDPRAIRRAQLDQRRAVERLVAYLDQRQP